nr:restriction endonuclease subunit S [Bifidobacterium breve]
MMTEQAKVPTIRFAGFTDPWEQRKLGELCAISKGHGYSKADIRDAGTPLILYGRLYTQYESRIDDVDTFAVEQEGSLLSKGNEVIVPASGETAEDIAVASSVRRSGIIFGGDLNVVTPVNKLDPDYTALAITYSKAHDDLAKRAQGKSVVHVHGNDIAEVEVSYPSESEQKRISTAVLGLDNLITLHQRKYDKLVILKKSMLEKMFPKDGESVPEIRFAGFTDPWEQRKLGELCAISKGHGYSKADIRDAGTPLILYGRLYTQYESRIDDVDTFAVEQEGSLLSKGNEVIVPASGETAEDIAVASSVRRSGIIFGGDLNVVTPVNKLDPDYTALAITYSKAHDDLAKRAQGKSVVHVHGNDIAEVEVSYPSESEQKRISTAVLGLDNLITLHQRKLELLQNIKKSLLDKMFV